MNENYGIDYGMGTTNISPNGIRYGVINVNDLAHWVWDEFEPDYGEPTCPQCGNTVVEESEIADTSGYGNYSHFQKYSYADYVCTHCEIVLGSDDVYGEEPIGWSHNKDGYCLTMSGGDNDIFVLQSPYYTHAQYCSPCAPGACHLGHPVDENGPRCYCLGHEWFEDGKAPYTVFNVADGSIVLPRK